MTFHIQIPSKCIITGEHTILQQGFAIVTPFNQYNLSLSYTPDSTIKTMYTISLERNSSLETILWLTINKALKMLNQDPSRLTGLFNINSTIIAGGGLGFSAALCVAVTEWLIYYGLLPRSQLFEFSIALENMFHGQSSGVDVAGVLAKTMIQYFATHEITMINQHWQPKLYISNSGEISFTGPCVNKVKALRQTVPEKAKIIDNKMITSANLVKSALETDKESGLPLLIEGINLGNECFYDWELVSPPLHRHITEIKKHALACKIIGAGLGGHVVSLWKEVPPQNMPFPLHLLNNSVT